MKGIGGKANVDRAEANDWLEVSASERIAITDLSPLSLLRAFSSSSSNYYQRYHLTFTCFCSLQLYQGWSSY